MPEITVRQRRYKRNRIAGMSQYNAAIAAGYSETYARQSVRIERVLKVSIQDALERSGLTDKYVCEKLYDLTNSDNSQVQIGALKHVNELKGHIKRDINLDQSQHTVLVKVEKLDRSEVQTPRSAVESISR